MSRPKTSRARWSVELNALVLPLPELWVVRLAAQLHRRGMSGVEAVGAWLRSQLRAAVVAQRRGPRSALVRTPRGVRIRAAAESEQAVQLRKRNRTDKKYSKIK